MGHSVWSWYCPDSVVLFLAIYTLAVMHRSGINNSQRAHPSLFFFRLQDGRSGWRRWARGAGVHRSQSPQLSRRPVQSKVLQTSECFGYVASSISLALRLILKTVLTYTCACISVRTSGIRIHFLFFSYPLILNSGVPSGATVTRKALLFCNMSP